MILSILSNLLILFLNTYTSFRTTTADKMSFFRGFSPAVRVLYNYIKGHYLLLCTD